MHDAGGVDHRAAATTGTRRSRWSAAAASIRLVDRLCVDRLVPPAGDGRRAPRRSRRAVRRPPRRRRTALRARAWPAAGAAARSTGITRRSDTARCVCYGALQIANCTRNLQSAICNLQSSMPADHSEVPTARALLAVRRSAGAADRRRAGRARSRSARGAVRRAGRGRSRSRWSFPARHARVRSRAGAGARRRPSSARPAPGAGAPLPRPLLVDAMRRGCAICSRSSAVGRDRGADRRSARAVRARAVAAARLVPPSPVRLPCRRSAKSNAICSGSKPS